VDRGIGVLLPCTVVIAAEAGGSTVRILNPQVMSSLTGREELRPIADEAARRLRVVLDDLRAVTADPDR
jgi:uncharacterized protein (DUF302 family)